MAEKIERINLRITGVSENAYMTAIDKEGVSFELHPDGNRSAGHTVYLLAAFRSTIMRLRWGPISCSLDFFNNLVRRRV